LAGWKKDFGGYTSYIAEGEDEEVSRQCYVLSFHSIFIYSFSKHIEQ